MRFFQNTPMAIATVDKTGRIARSNARFASAFEGLLKSNDRSILSVIVERERPVLEAAIRKAAEGQSDIAPVEASLTGSADRWANFFVIAVEEEDRDGEAAIVYALETTAQRTLENRVPATTENGIRRSIGGRYRPRFQQCSLRHHDGDRFFAERAQADRSVLQGHYANQAKRQPRGRACAAAPGVFTQADLASAGARSRRNLERPRHAAQAAHRREGFAGYRAWARPLAGQSRHFAVRAGDREPGGQCPRRHAEWRQTHRSHEQRASRRLRQIRLQGHARRQIMYWSKSATAGPEFLPTSSTRSSNRFSPPKTSARARGLGFPLSMEL